MILVESNERFRAGLFFGEEFPYSGNDIFRQSMLSYKNILHWPLRMIKCSGSGELFSTIRIGSVGGRVGWWLLLVDGGVFGLQQPVTCFLGEGKFVFSWGMTPRMYLGWIKHIAGALDNHTIHSANFQPLNSWGWPIISRIFFKFKVWNGWVRQYKASFPAKNVS